MMYVLISKIGKKVCKQNLLELFTVFLRKVEPIKNL